MPFAFSRFPAVRGLFLFMFLFFHGNLPADTPEDMVLADFEGETYDAGWMVEGTAFGTGPARGTLPNQMEVSGFLGRGLVNSYLGGDDATGKLTSPVFRIERKYLSFLLGGGGHPGLAINLLVDSEIVRTAAGPNVVPGGSERLAWHDWEVSELAGKEARIEIVDDARGGWGHINVDHIIQTSRPHTPHTPRKDFAVTEDYLHIPVKMSAQEVWVRMEVDGVWQEEFRCPLVTSGEPDFYGNLYVGPWKGKTVTLIAEDVPAETSPLDGVMESDVKSHEDTIYTESRRPRFHFSTRTGWVNDPNGLVYHDGVWHLFYQHNPYSTRWGNMTWGHATSPDLIHWTEWPTAIHPDKLGTIFSGSGVVDHRNTSGLQPAESDVAPIVLFYTYDGGTARFGAPVTQGMAYSADGGQTFTKYDKNPVLPHIIGGNRDPKVIWHEESQKWIMALYMDGEDYALFGSENLKDWEKLCDIKNLGCSECPDFFPLAVDGDEDNVKWVFWGGNGKYLVGTFDGKEFHRETEPLTNRYGGNDYAAMTFSNAPAERRIQISWMATWGDTESTFAGMPFNHQFTVPRELTLRATPAGPRLFMMPVKEVETLRGDEVMEYHISRKGIISSMSPDQAGDLMDMEFDLKMDGAKKVAISFPAKEIKIEYDVEAKIISLDGIRAPLDAPDGKLSLRILMDVTSVELFAQDGEVQIAKCVIPKKTETHPSAFTIHSEGGKFIISHRFWVMKSIWGKSP